MKKIIVTLMAGLGLMYSAATMAGTAIVSGGDITDTECSLLGETTRINLSKLVHGAYNCDTATNAIAVAACNEAGSRAEKTVQCAVIGVDAAGANIWNDSSCTATTDTFTYVDFSGYAASSKGGTVGEVQLGGSCTDAQVAGLAVLNP